MKCQIEICANSIESAIAACNGGAKRVELCSALPLDGLTPGMGAITWLKQHTGLKVNVLIRPREGNFCYSEAESDQMILDIRNAAIAGCDGVVSGAVDIANNVDKKLSARLIQTAKEEGVSFTFHRAIDVTCDIFKSLEDVISLGADRILTSGGEKSAFEGIDVISKMVREASGRIIIMPGGGINPFNAVEIVSRTGASEIHLSASDTCRAGYLLTQESTVRAVIEAVNI